MSPVSVTHAWRGSHTNGGGHPKMADTKLKVLRETQDQLANKILERPGVSFVEYAGSHGDKNATTGWGYYFNGEETYTFSGEDSDTSSNKWRGTVTCHLKATFDKQRIE